MAAAIFSSPWFWSTVASIGGSILNRNSAQDASSDLAYSEWQKLKLQRQMWKAAQRQWERVHAPQLQGRNIAMGSIYDALNLNPKGVDYSWRTGLFGENRNTPGNPGYNPHPWRGNVPGFPDDWNGPPTVDEPGGGGPSQKPNRPNVAGILANLAGEADMKVGRNALRRRIPRRALGGPIRAGQPYIVGDDGEEVIVPDRDGFVIPNHALPGGSTDLIRYPGGPGFDETGGGFRIGPPVGGFSPPGGNTVYPGGPGFDESGGSQQIGGPFPGGRGTLPNRPVPRPMLPPSMPVDPRPGTGRELPDAPAGGMRPPGGGFSSQPTPWMRGNFLNRARMLDRWPGRANGGPIAAGRGYRMGERGPEIVVPRNFLGRFDDFYGDGRKRQPDRRRRGFSPDAMPGASGGNTIYPGGPGFDETAGSERIGRFPGAVPDDIDTNRKRGGTTANQQSFDIGDLIPPGVPNIPGGPGTSLGPGGQSGIPGVPSFGGDDAPYIPYRVLHPARARARWERNWMRDNPNAGTPWRELHPWQARQQWEENWRESHPESPDSESPGGNPGTDPDRPGGGRPDPKDNPTYGDFVETPGYQWMFDEGMRAIEGSAAANGMQLSGRTLRGLERYGHDLADAEYGDYLNRLFTTAGLNQVNSDASPYANFANLMGNTISDQGYANAYGTLGSGNAWASGLNQLSSMFGSDDFQDWWRDYNRPTENRQDAYGYPDG